MIEFGWVGADIEERRVWGYLVDDEHPYHVVKTFWGPRDGRLFFQTTKKTYTFWKNVSKKRKKYCKQSDDLSDLVLDEYKQLLVIRKLKYGF